MRLFLTTAFMLASGSAFASSITVVGGTIAASPSIIVQHCTDCGRSAPPSQSTYSVPSLEPGTQRTEIVEIGGEKKLARTEAWLGGSPVVYVSRFPKWMVDEKAVAKLDVKAGGSTESNIANTPVAAGDGIDVEATTSAVAQQPAMGTTAAPHAPADLALESFDLRLSSIN